jgi:uroporphyrinogen decarboxylase
MPLRDEFLKTIRREQDAPVPYFFCLCQAVVESFRQKYGHTDYRREYQIPLQEIFLKPTRLDPKEVYGKYLTAEDKEGVITEWGIRLEPGSVAHLTHMVGPLRNSASVRDVECFPLPDFLEDYRWDGVEKTIAEQKRRDKIVFPGIYGGYDSGTNEKVTAAFMDIFESSWYLRGLDQMLVDFYENEEFAEALLEKVTVLKCALAERWTRAGVDILITADDVGAQNGLMISADMYRKWIKPRLKRVIDSAKAVNPDVLIFYHSDGNILEIIPDLIEAGVEILNPVQPECMDPLRLMEEYGNRLSFWGAVGTQSVLPFGSPADVEKVCHALLDARIGKGGLILAPTHLVEPEVLLENVEALVNKVRSYNRMF